MKQKVNFDPTTVDSNAFSLLGHFAIEAKRAGWSKEEIKEVKTEAMKGDYDHLIVTIMEHCNIEAMAEDYE